MAQQAQQKQGQWSSFIATLLMAGFIAMLALIPSQAIEQTWQAETSQIKSIGGDRAHVWIRAQMAGFMSDIVKSGVETETNLGTSKVENWVRDRIYASLLWANLALYRAASLLMWSLIGLPLIMAAAVDGFYVREIRKMAFTSQSPIRHKIGIHFFRMVSIALLFWLMLPVPMPMIAAPLVIVFFSVSTWLWVGNLQKRI